MCYFLRLFEANSDLEQLNEVHWKLDVIENSNVDQVLAARSTGNLLIFSKMINDCESDDELAFVFCHELAHCMLEHYRELVRGFHCYFVFNLCFFTFSAKNCRWITWFSHNSVR